MQPYRPRKPQVSPVWQCLSKHFDAFLDVYEERYQDRYGFLRPVIPVAVAEFLKCGDLREGFARVRCADCGHSLFVAFSCKQRCVCPSCHQKRALRTALHVEGEVRAPVAHRQFVFTMPKRFRLYFRFNRDLLRKLPPLAWATIREVHRTVLNRRDLVPGVIVSIQTHGELAHWHPHLHALVTDGAFTPDGQFIPMPDIPTEPYRKLWEQRLFNLLLAEGRITPEIVAQMRSWKYSGFSVDHRVRLEADDAKGIERLTQYLVRCPFSLDRILKLTADGEIIYRAEHTECRRFPRLGDDDLAPGLSRNFEIFDPLDFIAEITQHIPDPGMQMIRYYGWYSNRMRGDRVKAAAAAQSAPNAPVPMPLVLMPEAAPSRKSARMRWAALIKKVYEADPLLCPRCGGQMAIIAFLEKRDQAGVIQKILRHCGLWEDPPARAPPAVLAVASSLPDATSEWEYVPDEEYQSSAEYQPF
jgi:hypothetical protein